MSSKLYPPYIEGVIPAFSGTVITVPFSMNRAVSKNQVAGFALKIKTVQSNTFITTILNTDSSTWDLENCVVKFIIPEDREDIKKYFNIGQYYKVQLAYLTSDEVGYYSTVGIVKYTTEPLVEIKGLELGQINNHNYQYFGYYSQKGGDTTEKLYSSKFIVYNAKGAIIDESEEILHNLTEDTEIYESTEEWILKRDLEVNSSYYIQYIVTTTNKMVVKTPKYRLMQKKTIEPDLKADLIATMNYDEGYVDLTLQGVINEFGLEEPETGVYVICRTSEEEDNVWYEIVRFKLESEVPSRFLWRDFTVQQGIKYTYSVQQYNNIGLYSERILNKIYNEYGELITAPIFVDFEDMFLFDGKRQLKVKYNPSVSNFKRTIHDAKIETLGSKYPFFLRNGAVDYKEFPISGLISYFMDENNLFLTKDEFLVEDKTTNLISENIYAERIFKMKVLEWLSNGIPKLLRTPTEGNYIVRLTDVSLSPNETVGRMLHTFSASAAEVAEYTYDSLSNYSLINTNDPTIKQTRWKTVSLSGKDEELRQWAEGAVSRQKTVNDTIISNGTIVPDRLYNLIVSACKDSFNGKELKEYIDPDTKEVLSGFRVRKYETDEDGNIKVNPYGELQEYLMNAITFASGKINDRPVDSVYFTDLLPGTKIQLDDNIIVIGPTGTYQVSGTEISSIIIPPGQQVQGSITYSYESSSSIIFDTIYDIEIVDVPAKQFWGGWSKTYIDYSQIPPQTVTTRNVKDNIEDCKTTILDIHKIHLRKRRLQQVYVSPNWLPTHSTFEMYYDKYCKNIFNKEEADPYTVYDIYLGLDLTKYQTQIVEGEEYYIDANGHIFTPRTKYLYDPMSKNVIKEEEYSPIFYYNGNEISLYKTEEFIIEDVNIKDFKSLVLDNGVFAEMSYQVRIANYLFEQPDTKEYQNVYIARQAYDNAVNALKQFLLNLDEDNQVDEDEELRLRNAVNVYYSNLVRELDETIIQYKEANALL